MYRLIVVRLLCGSQFLKLWCTGLVGQFKDNQRSRIRTLFQEATKEARSEVGLSLLEVAIVSTIMGVLGASA